MTTMRINTRFPLALLLAVSSPAIASAQSPAPCALQKGIYTCQKSSFEQSLHAAQTIAVETQPTDHTSAPQLRALVRALGKTSQDAPADLTFLVIPTPTDGVFVGPSGTELATLRVYASAPQGQRGNLLWVETFSGQPDMTWPAVVHALIQQFQSKFK